MNAIEFKNTLEDRIASELHKHDEYCTEEEMAKIITVKIMCLIEKYGSLPRKRKLRTGEIG